MGKARYRDYDTDMDGRDYARNLMVTLTGEELPLDDESFDEEIQDNLQYDQFSDVKGLIALFYRNLWAMADLRETLKAYEDKQEQGLMLKAKPNDRVYVISCGNIFPKDIIRIEISAEGIEYICFGFSFLDSEIGKTVLLTETEAEEALARMKGE